MTISTFRDQRELASAGAKHFVARSVAAAAERGIFTVALSGGSTPKSLFQLLADPTEPFRAQIPWSKCHVFWSDERHVPPNHPDSNYRMANEALLKHVPVKPGNVHRVRSENPSATAAAAAYEADLVKMTGRKLPQLDLILLGLGADGHTASIFPGSELLEETTRLVAAPWVEQLKTHRITMTLPVLNNAASVAFLVSGAEKAEIVNRVFEGPEAYPAQAVKPVNGELVWLLDNDAASKLQQQLT